MTQTLYEIDQAIREVLEAHLDEETGEISEEGFQALEKLEGDRDRKLLAYAAVSKEYDVEAKAHDAVLRALAEEADRIRKRRNAAEATKRRLRDVLFDALREGRRKLKDATTSVYWSKSTAVVFDEGVELEIVEGALLGDFVDYVKTHVEIDRKKLTAALREHQESMTAGRGPLLPEAITDRCRLIESAHLVIR